MTNTAHERRRAAPVKVGDIVQVKPDAKGWRGCLVIVTETKGWGVMGFTPIPPNGGMAFIRIANEDFERTGGRAVWSSGSKEQPDV